MQECKADAAEESRMAESVETMQGFVRRVPLHELPGKHRTWTGNDTSGRCHHGLIPAGEDVVFIELRWKSSAGANARVVGGFEIRLRPLVREGILTRTNDGQIRLKFIRGSDGSIYVGRAMGMRKISLGRHP